MSSESNNPDAISSSNSKESGVKQDENSNKTFSQDEVNNIVRKRINEINAKSEASIADAVEKAKIEWERQAKLTEEERASEAQKAKARELEERDRSLTLRERKADALVLMTEKKLPSALVDYVVDMDSDKTKANIEALSEAWNKAVEEGVKAKLKLAGNTPTDYGDGNKTTDNDETLTSRGYRKSGMTAF